MTMNKENVMALLTIIEIFGVVDGPTKQPNNRPTRLLSLTKMIPQHDYHCYVNLLCI